MTVQRHKRYLNQLLDEDRKSHAEVVATIKERPRGQKFLAQSFLVKYRHRFVSEAPTKERFPTPKLGSKASLLKWLLERIESIPENFDLLVEAIRGQLEQLSHDGTPSPEEMKKVREKARELNFLGIASIAKVPPNAKVDNVETALKKVIGDIKGFAFLDKPPRGKGKNEHTVLIKVGVNWGIFGYPTVSSWESVYAVTKMCLKEAKDRGATVTVIVGDESGIENRLWGGKTMDNFEHTGILHAAVLAGIEWAASMEAADPEKFKGAGEMLNRLREGHKVTERKGDTYSEKMRGMALRAGVDVIGFEDKDFKQIRIPEDKEIKHFKEGILVPRRVAEEVTDIINLPKPPGRHLIMGNTGLTGALKNHVGLLKGSDRSRVLHGEGGRLLGCWSEHGPGMGFHEKIVEIYLAFEEKERFSATDMRWTVSSLGPDLGDTIDIGAVIAAKDPLTLDALAGAFLKRRYEKIGSWFDALKWGGDTLTEYLAGRTWLRSGNPFDLMSHIAANSYGVGPIDLKHIEPRYSGFTEREIEAVKWYLMRRDGFPPRRVKLYSTIGLWAGVVAVSLAVTAAAAWAKSNYSQRREPLQEQ